MKDFWDNRYSSEEFVYGAEPNQFFKSRIEKITPGRLLALAEGEGRNGIYAGSVGWEIDAVDFSVVASEKALRLAAKKNIKINYIVNDLLEYEPPANTYDAVSMIFLHLDHESTRQVHKRAIKSLKTGGQIIFEGYAKEQLGKKSGGPQNPDMLYSIEEIQNNFHDLKTITLKKEVIYLNESRYHSGEAVVIRYVGEKVI